MPLKYAIEKAKLNKKEEKRKYAKMKIAFLMTGKTSQAYFCQAISEYEKRIKRFIPFELITIPDTKGYKNSELQKEQEGELILKNIKNDDYVILLDERGAYFSSGLFADKIDKLIGNSSYRRILFVIGGAYGFDRKVYERGNEKISLSAMTFSHQLVRVVFTEQLYRAFTIINNLPYHHE